MQRPMLCGCRPASVSKLCGKEVYDGGRKLRVAAHGGRKRAAQPKRPSHSLEDSFDGAVPNASTFK